MTLFEHLNNIYERNPNWTTLSESDKKTFSPYMANRFISMLGKKECLIVDMIHKYKLDNQQIYTFYQSVLGNKKRFASYIKGSKEEKVNMDLVKILAELHEISTREAMEYLELIEKDDLVELLEDLGIEKSEIKKLMK